LVHDGRVYAVDRAANQYVIDAATGKSLVKKTLELAPADRADGPNIYRSICLAGKQLFIGNDAGESMLLEPGDKLAVVATNSLPGGSGASPTLSGQRMFIRGGKVLHRNPRFTHQDMDAGSSSLLGQQCRAAGVPSHGVTVEIQPQPGLLGNRQHALTIESPLFGGNLVHVG